MAIESKLLEEEFVGMGYSADEAKIMANAAEAANWFVMSTPPPVSGQQAAEALNNMFRRLAESESEK